MLQKKGLRNYRFTPLNLCISFAYFTFQQDLLYFFLNVILALLSDENSRVALLIVIKILSDLS